MAAEPKYTAATLTCFDTSAELKGWSVARRKPQGTDVFIRTQFCGICHSDLHQIRAEWAIDNHYPMTPGHEIVGIVEEVGPDVKKFKVGERVGVGCMVDSCRTCDWCRKGDEQYCVNGSTLTYNDPKHPHGGYSTCITVREEFVVHVPAKLDMAVAAPLLCAGITTYSPLVYFGAKAAGPEYNVAILGLGGLGHVAVKLSVAMKNNVTVLSRGEKKKAFAEKLGAKYVNYNDPEQVKAVAGKFDLIIDAVSADHPIENFLSMVKTSGKFVLVGAPPNKFQINPMALIFRRLTVAASLIGGIRETQEMLDFCADHGVSVDVELIHAKDINHAMYKLGKGANEHGRYVIKIAETLKAGIEVEKEPASFPPDWVVLGNCHPPESNLQAKK